MRPSKALMRRARQLGAQLEFVYVQLEPGILLRAQTLSCLDHIDLYRLSPYLLRSDFLDSWSCLALPVLLFLLCMYALPGEVFFGGGAC